MPAGIGLIAVAKANDEADAGGFDPKAPVQVKAANAAAQQRINRRKRRGSLRNVIMRKDSDSGAIANTAAILQQESQADPTALEARSETTVPDNDFPEPAQSVDDDFGDGFDDQLTDAQADSVAHYDEFESDTEAEDDVNDPITVAPAAHELLTDVDDDDDGTDPEDDLHDDLDGFGEDEPPKVSVVTVIPAGTTHLEVTYDTDDDE